MARRKAAENNIEYRKMYSAQYDTRHKVQDSTLSLVDQVFVTLPAKQKFKNAKLQPLFEGPFDLVRIKPPNVYYKVGKKTCVAHMSRVKKANLVTSELPSEQICSPRLRQVADDDIVEVEHVYAPQRVASPPLSPPHPSPADVTWSNVPVNDSVFPSIQTYRTADRTIDTDTSSDSDEQEHSNIFDDDLDSSRHMDQNELSHIFRDTVMTDVETSGKRKDLSPPQQPDAKLAKTEPSPPSQSALADLGRAIFRPFTRSHGPVHDIPLPSFPIESKCHSKRLADLEVVPEPDDSPPPTSDPFPPLPK